MKLKQLFYCLFFLLIAFACSSDNKYHIQGRFDGAPDSTVVYLLDDSTFIINGNFSFEGEMQNPQLTMLKVAATNEYGYPDFKGVNLWIEPGNITVQCPWDALPYSYVFSNSITIEGSHLNQIYSDYRQQLLNLPAIAPLQQEYIVQYLIPAMKWEGVNEEKGKDLVRQMNDIKSQQRSLALNFIQNNPSSPISLVVLRSILTGQSFTSDEAMKLIQSLDNSLKTLSLYTDLLNSYNDFIVTAKGTPYHDLKLRNLDGKEVLLSDNIKKGEYTLLEFWASWCKPCRAEIPHLCHVAKAYAGKLNIISISLDEVDSAWKNAVRAEKMDWLQLNDPSCWKGETGQKYKISGVPFSLLLDGEGKIIAGELRGAELDVVLDSLFQKQNN